MRDDPEFTLHLFYQWTKATKCRFRIAEIAGHQCRAEAGARSNELVHQAGRPIHEPIVGDLIGNPACRANVPRLFPPANDREAAKRI